MSAYPQGSTEWLRERVGRVTASRVADVLARTKSGPSADRANYLAELVCERLTGEPAASVFATADMQRGTEMEPQARAAYELATGSMVLETGFVQHPTLMAGASPDGLIGSDGLLEIKCPKTATHISYLERGEPPAKYVPQMAWQIICTGRKWCDFASYDPRLPGKLSLFVVRFTPTAEQLENITAEVSTFIHEVDRKVEALRKIAA